MHHRLFDIDGARVSRLEDLRLITGRGRYASDHNLPGQLHACFLRSDRGHANILSIDADAARACPGVVAVLTGEDALRAGYVAPLSTLTFKGKNGMKARVPQRPVIAHARVRHVGEPVALVVAESFAAAQDAAESIVIEYEDLPAVVSPVEALSPGAPQLHDAIPGNLPFEYEIGDAAAVDAAFAGAAHVTSLRVESTRVIPNPMEPRACLVRFDATEDRYQIFVSVQGVNMMRRQLAIYTGVPEDRMEIVAHDVGGGFGQRTTAYPEYCALMMAAKATGRPVKWISTRSEGFLADAHGRANTIGGRLALDRDGRFLALRLDWITDQGAYLSPTGSTSHIRNPVTCLTGVYRIPAIHAHFRVALTNTASVGPYRGAGRPDIAYAIERLVARAAIDTGIDVIELKRRNFIPPEAFPYRTPTGSVYEHADLPGLMDEALALADWQGFPERRRRSADAGKLRGIGISTVIENTGGGVFPKDEIAMEAHADGTITAYSVSHSQGQGHETSFAMVIEKALGVPAERIRIRQGVPGKPLIGNHSGGSRTMVGAGTVCHLAAVKLIEHGRSLAAERLKVEPSQVSYAAGVFSSAEGGELTLGDLARNGPLTVTAEGSFGSTFPNGCHIAEVEIDPATGTAKIVSYVAVDDCGIVVNHVVVEGQMHGAVAQGAGQVFGEHIVYDPETAQLLTGSFSDYFMPRAGLVPEIRMEERPIASGVGPLGIKGMGESGCTASLGALVNAAIDALRPLGIRHLDMPLTPSKLWHAIQEAKKPEQ